MTTNIDDNLDGYEDSGEDFQANVVSMPSIKLCEVIATFRYIGLLRNEALISMAELSRRRILGDEFVFEDEIDRVLAELPKIKKDLQSMFKIPSFNLSKLF
jgi:hypothetical protein